MSDVDVVQCLWVDLHVWLARSIRIHRPSRSLNIHTRSTVIDRHNPVDIMVDIYFYRAYIHHPTSSLAGKTVHFMHQNQHITCIMKDHTQKCVKCWKIFTNWPQFFRCTRNSSVKHAVAFNNARQLTGKHHKQTHDLANE